MPSSHAPEALRHAAPKVFWSDRPDAPDVADPLAGSKSADLTIIGGGFTGLWAALIALEEEPGISVVVLEAERCGYGASSRNGGFCDASLTHGIENGLSHWPNDIDVLQRLGRENLDAIEAAVERHSVSADFRRTAEIGVATEEWHLEAIRDTLDAHERGGDEAEILDADAMRSRLDSPTYLGGIIRRNDLALVDPARLCWGLRIAVERLGGRVYEMTPVQHVEESGSALRVVAANGTVDTDKAIVATNAYSGPVRRQRRYVIPVYDHVLMTEPLSAEQMSSIGWSEREGIGDVSSQFHYYRLTEDDRILWGGYDATYHYGNGIHESHEQEDGTHGKLARHFFETFPQLEGLRFTHRWGGVIGTTTRFTTAWGTDLGGRLAWSAGYTGLGVGASRFGAQVALDLVNSNSTERTDLTMVRENPFPFPPEPFRWTGVQLTRRAIQKSDRHEGKQGPWLKLLDRFGIGFDS